MQKKRIFKESTSYGQSSCIAHGACVPSIVTGLSFWSKTEPTTLEKEQLPPAELLTIQSRGDVQKQNPLEVKTVARRPSVLNFCDGCDRVPMAMLNSGSPNRRAARVGDGTRGLNVSVAIWIRFETI